MQQRGPVVAVPRAWRRQEWPELAEIRAWQVLAEQKAQLRWAVRQADVPRESGPRGPQASQRRADEHRAPVALQVDALRVHAVPADGRSAQEVRAAVERRA